MLLVEDVLEEYIYHCLAKGFTKKTMKNKRQEFKHWKIYLKEKRGIDELGNITVHDLRAYVRLKQKDGLQPQSIVSMFKMIKAFFNWCVQEGYLKENIAKQVELPKQPKKVLNGFTPKEVRGMIDAFSYKNYIEARNKAIVAMLADCGLRAMELTGLKSLNVKEDSILVDGKGNKQRVVFISPALKKILIKYDRLKKQYFQDKFTDEYYFLNYLGKPLSHVGLYNIIRDAGDRAGVEKARVSPHTFRHFYAVQCVSSGIDVYSLSRLLGHSDISVTQRYLHTMSDSVLMEKAVLTSPLMNLGR
jgi:integrase/recombinase XerD